MTTPTNCERAKSFAREWYRRTQDGCDEATLAIFAEALLNDAERSIRAQERTRVRVRLLKAAGLE